MTTKSVYIGLDVGGARIGLALGDSIGRVASPLGVVVVDGQEFAMLQRLVTEHGITDVVIGCPRNQSGAPTTQTDAVRVFADELAIHVPLPQHWQDESVTSVLAEERLQARKKPYTKADIDAEAAAIILQDFLEHAA